MKNFVFILIIFFSGVVFAYSNELEFELLGTDFTGIFHTENKVFVYGKYGIINYSNDLGITWKKTNIGKNYDILKIISVDDKIYALTTERIYAWNNKSNFWDETFIRWGHNFVDFCTDGNRIFIITANEILSIDKELKSDLKLLFKFDTFTKFTEMALWEKYLFIIDANISIVKFNIQTNAPEDTLFTGFGTQEIERFKVRDSTIYVLLVSDDRSPSFYDDYQIIRHTVLFSKDFGKTWKIFAKHIPITRDYLIEGNEIHTLAPKFVGKEKNLSVSFVKADTSGLFEENDVVEPNVWLPIFQFNSDDVNTFRINSIEKVSDSIIIACGVSHTILISRDNGKKWAFTSYFRPLYSLFFNKYINQIVKRGEDTIAVLSYYPPYMFASSDKGATFRTLGIDTNFKRLLSVFKSPLTPPNGKLGYFIFEQDEKRKFTGTIRTIELDIVNNEYHTNDIELKPYESFKWDSVEVLFIRDPLYLKGNIILPTILQIKGYSSSSSIIFVLDSNLKLIDTLFSSKVAPDFVQDENYLYTYSSDSENTYVLKINSLKSDWEIVASIPQVNYRKPNEKVDLALTKVLKNHFIFTKTVYKDLHLQWYLLFLDKFSGHIDSIEVTLFQGLFSIDDTVFVLTNSWLREFPNLPQDTSYFIEYSIPNNSGIVIKNIFRWNNQDYIAWATRYGDFYEPVWEANFGIFKRMIQKPNVVIEEVRPYLFCFPLYPNPSWNYIDLPLCWEAKFSIEDINFSCFNLYGQKLEIPYFLVAQPTNNCGVMRFSLNNLSPNIYFINVKLHSSEWTLPFVINK